MASTSDILGCGARWQAVCVVCCCSGFVQVGFHSWGFFLSLGRMEDCNHILVGGVF